MRISKLSRASVWIKGLVLSSVLLLLLSGILVDLLRVKSTEASILELPAPMQILPVSEKFSYPVLKGIRLNKDNPLQIEFLIDSYDKETVSKSETARIINYFLAGLTTKESDLWVNLSPYESDRIMYDGLEKTDFGKELLSQDYILKQFVASLTYPDSEIGKLYWDSAQLKDDFNKVWIMPSVASVVENGTMAYVKEASLDVKYEKDYLAQLENGPQALDKDPAQNVMSELAKEQLLAKVSQEVNSGQNFAQLRQLYHSLVLATWFKQKFKDSFFRHYIDKDRISGIDFYSSEVKEEVYSNYVESFKKGVYDISKKERQHTTGKKIRRRYTSGGVVCSASAVFATEFEAKLSPKMSGLGFWVKGSVQAEYEDNKVFSSAVKNLPKLDFAKVESVIKADTYEEEELIKKNFKRAVNYFNTKVLRSDFEGNLPKLGWHELLMIFAYYRGDVDNEGFIDIHDTRLMNVLREHSDILDKINAREFNSYHDLFDSIANIYAWMIEYQPFGKLDGFHSLIEQGQENSIPESGHNRLAWFIANYMLINNGYEYFYFNNSNDQSILNGKARGRYDIDFMSDKKNIVYKHLYSLSELKKTDSQHMSSSVNLPKLDYERTKKILKHKNHLKESYKTLGLEDLVKEVEIAEQINTEIQRNNFKKAIEYFNDYILKYDEDGNMIPVTWEELMHLYALFRGDLDGHGILTSGHGRQKTDVLEMSYDAELLQKTRIKSLENNDDGMLRIINKKYDNKYAMLNSISELYVHMIEVQPFVDREGFHEVVEKGAGFSAPESGHNRLAWFMTNIILANNGYELFYFNSYEDQMDLNGKAGGRKDISMKADKSAILYTLLGDIKKTQSSSFGGIDLNDIDIEVEASTALLADVDIDFEALAGFAYEIESLDKVQKVAKFFDA